MIFWSGFTIGVILMTWCSLWGFWLYCILVKYQAKKKFLRDKEV